ncbi:hypothetical protein ABPG74_015847 [Tetrahymena malaccensis]
MNQVVNNNNQFQIKNNIIRCIQRIAFIQKPDLFTIKSLIYLTFCLKLSQTHYQHLVDFRIWNLLNKLSNKGICLLKLTILIDKLQSSYLIIKEASLKNMQPNKGKRIQQKIRNRQLLKQQLEQGSGSEIWEGKNSSRDCIFKMVKKNQNASTYAQLVNEYEILKKKIPNSHPNIVKIYDLYHNIEHPNDPEQPVVALSMKKYTYDGIRCLREYQNAVPMVKI